MNNRPDDDIDARFAELVEQLRAMPQTPPPAPPDAPDAPPNPPPNAPGASINPPPNAPGAGLNPPQNAPGVLPDPPDPGQDQDPPPPQTWREWVDPEVEEHFIPPDPPPMPAGDLHFWGIVIGLLGGPLLLVLTTVFAGLRSPLWTWLGVGLGIGGVVLLVLRLPTQRDDDPSGGAQV